MDKPTLDAVTLACFYDARRNLEPKIADAVYEQAMLALAQAERIATLEAEVAEAQQAATFGTPLVVDAYKADRDAALAQAATLRDALEKGNRRLGYWCDLHGSLPEDVAALGAMQAALASTPAASLAAYRKSVLEEAATCAESYLWNLPALQSQVGANCGDAIRALAAQEVKP